MRDEFGRRALERRSAERMSCWSAATWAQFTFITNAAPTFGSPPTIWLGAPMTSCPSNSVDGGAEVRVDGRRRIVEGLYKGACFVVDMNLATRACARVLPVDGEPVADDGDARSRTYRSRGGLAA